MAGKQHKDRDVGSRDKDKDREKERDPEKTRSRKSSRSHRKSSSSLSSEPPVSTSLSSRRKKAAAATSPASELSRSRSSQTMDSAFSSKTSLPYPPFSKTHSKEAVGRSAKIGILTPNPTDVSLDGGAKNGASTARPGANGVKESARASSGAVPPSPPLTTVSEAPSDVKRPKEQNTDGRKESEVAANATAKNASGSKSNVSVAAQRTQSKSTPSKPGTPITGRTGDSSSRTSRTARARTATSVKTSHAKVPESVASSEATTATEVLPRGRQDSVSSGTRPPPPPVHSRQIRRPDAKGSYDVGGDEEAAPAATHPIQSPQPPPPPPPPTVPVNTPRVDYLLQNGGLTQTIPRRLLDALPWKSPNPAPSPWPDPMASPAPDARTAVVDAVFAPFQQLLHHYETVISNNGSLAVATGYRSVARRLLDRLEAVFARDISWAYCECSLCNQPDTQDEEQAPRGLSWGEILEWVSGRKPVPAWPPFDFEGLGRQHLRETRSTTTSATSRSGLRGKVSKATLAPIDADVPAEFRDHYRQQTEQKKSAVDRWLASQLTSPSAPPQGIDDETLSFAILTHLTQQAERDFFNELLTEASAPPDDSASAQDEGDDEPRLLLRTATALQRLYRMQALPRLPECAAYLVRYPALHALLATLSVISASEWDILTSGRFDGFLWSGAEDPSATATTTTAAAASAAASPLRSPAPNQWAADAVRDAPRMGTPSLGAEAAAGSAAPSRGVTPALPGPPVSHDEDTEVAVLAEVEREIYLGMEALEDAFEALHRKAEAVRFALRERGVGLSVAGQARRPPWAAEAGAAGALDPFGLNGASCDSEDDGQWGAKDADAVSEVWPDDSASNISSNRVRRPKRRTERRTPAPVEECDEGE